MEIWKKSPLAPTFIEVSNIGRIRTLERIVTSPTRWGGVCTQKRPAKILSQDVGTHGYALQSIKDGETKRKYLIHRLVASCFCEGFDPTLTVNHKNGEKLDNRAENLEWITKRENTLHQWRTGLVNNSGENSVSHKLKTSDVHKVREMLFYSHSVKDIATLFNVSQSLIYFIKDGKRRRNG